MKRLYLDIETAPNDLVNPKLIQSLKENMRPDMRMKDLEKSKQDKFDKLMEEASINPLLNKIILIGIAIDNNNPISIYEKTELDTLLKFASILNQINPPDYVVTFNGQSFDLPIIKIRCAVNQIVINREILNLRLSKYDECNRDLRLILTNYDKFANGTLEQWAFLFGYDGELSTVSGADISTLYSNGKIDIIREKNLHDIELLRFLEHKISETI